MAAQQNSACGFLLFELLVFALDTIGKPAVYSSLRLEALLGRGQAAREDL
jgi:hypothetical protein